MSIGSNDNIYIDMQTGINLEVLRKCAQSTISVVRMAFYPLDCCSFITLFMRDNTKCVL